MPGERVLFRVTLLLVLLTGLVATGYWFYLLATGGTLWGYRLQGPRTWTEWYHAVCGALGILGETVFIALLLKDVWRPGDAGRPRGGEPSPVARWRPRETRWARVRWFVLVQLLLVVWFVMQGLLLGRSLFLPA